jgi:hypothetical protein
VDAHFCRDAAYNQRFNALGLEDAIQIGRIKAPFAGLVNDGFASLGIQFWNYVMTWFSLYQNETFRPSSTDNTAVGWRSRSMTFEWMQIGQFFTMSLASMDDQHVVLSSCVQHTFTWLDGTLQQADVVTEACAKPTGLLVQRKYFEDMEIGVTMISSHATLSTYLQEVDLHVNHNDSGLVKVNGRVVWLQGQVNDTRHDEL